MSDRLPEAQVSIPRGRFELDSFASSQPCQKLAYRSLRKCLLRLLLANFDWESSSNPFNEYKLLSVLNRKVAKDPVFHVPKISGGRIGKSCGIALLAEMVCRRLTIQATNLSIASLASAATVLTFGLGRCDTPVCIES